MSAEGAKDYEPMSWDDLLREPGAEDLMNSAALEFLNMNDKEYFDKHFTGELDADGYLIAKDPAEQGPVKPHMIVSPKGQDWVLKIVKQKLA